MLLCEPPQQTEREKWHRTIEPSRKMVSMKNTLAPMVLNCAFVKHSVQSLTQNYPYSLKQFSYNYHIQALERLINDQEGDETAGSGGFYKLTFLFSKRKPEISDRFNQVRLLGSATAGECLRHKCQAKYTGKQNCCRRFGLGTPWGNISFPGRAQWGPLLNHSFNQQNKHCWADIWLQEQ